MHGLRQIVLLNKEQEQHVAEILAKPVPYVDLIQVHKELKEQRNDNTGI